MKKFLSLALVAMLGLMVVGCGNQDATTDAPVAEVTENEVTETGVETEEEATEEETTEEATEEETTEETTEEETTEETEETKETVDAE